MLQGFYVWGAIHSLSDEDWNKTFSVNSTGVFYMSRAVSKHMMQKKVRGNCYSWFKCSKYAESGDGCICCIKSCNSDVYEVLQFIRGSTETEKRLLWADENGAKNIIAGSQNTYRLGIPLQKLHSLQKLLKWYCFSFR